LATRALGQQIHIVKATSEGEIEAVFAAFADQRPDALIIGSDPFFLSRHNQLVTLAATHAIPTMFFAREFVAAGGLISYGASLVNEFRELGAYAGKILSGAKPSELPVL
jgi:putative tryptophan/tyrosine transport system substrate-binding protein